MSVEALLSQLPDARQTGSHRWLARCPAHEDRHPSLSIRELDDGRVLLHDFGGCSAVDVLRAIGLNFTDLYPESAIRLHRVQGQRRAFPAPDVLAALAHEATVVAIVAARLGNGHVPTDDDRARMLVAATRIIAAVQETGYA